jgi:hypothetical protein
VSDLARYEIEVHVADGTHDPDRALWLTRAQVVTALGRLGNGDTMTVQRTDQDAAEGSEY